MVYCVWIGKGRGGREGSREGGEGGEGTAYNVVVNTLLFTVIDNIAGGRELVL